jgi:hypothetical protein
MNTTTPNDGGPAFPLATSSGSNTSVNGMTLRDWFAGQALGHIAAFAQADQWANSGPEWRDAVASESYKFADAMLAARVKTTNTAAQ